MSVSDTAIEFNGLTVVQVSQNQAAVISDPQVNGLDISWIRKSSPAIRTEFSLSRILASWRSQLKVEWLRLILRILIYNETALGSYDVLAIVDQTHLPGVIKDKSTGVTLGWCISVNPNAHRPAWRFCNHRTHEVKMKSSNGEQYHVALLSVLFFHVKWLLMETLLFDFQFEYSS